MKSVFALTMLAFATAATAQAPTPVTPPAAATVMAPPAVLAVFGGGAEEAAAAAHQAVEPGRGAQHGRCFEAHLGVVDEQADWRDGIVAAR